MEADAAGWSREDPTLRLDYAGPGDIGFGRSIHQRHGEGGESTPRDGPRNAMARRRPGIQYTLGPGDQPEVRGVEASAARLSTAAAPGGKPEHMGQTGRGGSFGTDQGEENRQDRNWRTVGGHSGGEGHDISQVLSRSQLGHRQVPVRVWTVLGASDSTVQSQLREDPAPIARPEPAVTLLGQDATGSSRQVDALCETANGVASRLPGPLQHHRRDGADVDRAGARLDAGQNHHQG